MDFVLQVILALMLISRRLERWYLLRFHARAVHREYILGPGVPSQKPCKVDQGYRLLAFVCQVPTACMSVHSLQLYELRMPATTSVVSLLCEAYGSLALSLSRF